MVNMNTRVVSQTHPLVRLIPGGWVIDRNLHRTPGVYESMASALLARELTDDDEQRLHAAACLSGNGNIRYEDVLRAVNGAGTPATPNPIALDKHRELDLSGDFDILDALGPEDRFRRR
jgi:hypothetical protein